ncbi:MAG: beta-lactamase-like, competence protein ComEC [Parcubacteria group bacterium GW2011_GWC1_41_7]|nr:MAG: beta-lactamase-like, competence protein ComEC [Parcubacteria group bacterium GW2011_GWC1_41_7]
MPVIIATLILANTILWHTIFLHQHIAPFVSFLDIGQGNSVLIANNASALLYDAGPSGLQTTQKISERLPFYRKTIDLIFLSHPDTDHYQGAFEVLKRYHVQALLVSPYTSQESGWVQLLQKAKQQGTAIIIVDARDTIATPSENILVLSPPPHAQTTLKTDNERSLVLSIAQKELSATTTFLLTGDIGAKTEKILTEAYTLKSDYLLVPHHGSKYSSSEIFLQSVAPRKAIVQVGKNKYGHPHQDTLLRLKKFSIPLWRTDINGTLKVE